MTSHFNFAQWMRQAQAQTEIILTHFLQNQQSTDNTTFVDAMRYAVLGGGKRVRALLAFAAAELGHADNDALQQSVAALEFIHAYSLVHDDLPAMDNDTLRRGRPTCHIQYGEAVAILVGDALQSAAFTALAADNPLPPSVRLERIALFARASGAQGMVGGQFIDSATIDQLHQPSQHALETMHRLKTGALIEAAVALGYTSCLNTDSHTSHHLKNYAQAIGLAFQIIDDILDYTTPSGTLGKTAGKDQAENKTTFVTLLGIDHAHRYATQLHQQALDTLMPIPANTDKLRHLANFILQRDY